MPRRHVIIVYALYVLLCIYLFILGPVVYPDTTTYFDAWSSISTSGVDTLRTPVYPVFLGIMQCLVGVEHCISAVIIMQMLIFGVSILYFYKAAYMLTERRTLCLVATLWYVLSPSCYGWLTCVLTETLSISMVTIFVYLTIRIWKYAASVCITVTYGGVLTLLLFIRPSFVYLIPATLILCLLYYLKHKVIAKGILASVIISSVLLIVYCGIIYSKTGVFTPSIVSMNNKIAIFQQSGITDCGSVQEPELKADLEMFMSYDDDDRYDRMGYMIDKYGLDEMYNLSSKYATDYPAVYAAKTVGRFYKLMYSDYGVGTALDAVLYPLVLKGKGIITICLAYIIAILYVMRRRHIPYLSITLLMMALGNISITVLGADAEFLRLVSVSLPLYMLFTVQIFNLINKSKAYTEVMM